ncbi:hypothetical protein VB780_21840 [Leptolyngbya sp. CCNP1308]|uniref:hypothetical protein n=1 Tax=Leptolyngbya sp. CCNP1308 TaxID=3110255 RepID=UPI002B209511|nr:hypothetical protein [Leptolyngbya sp. CCNP1308]MEA5451238.1 hypothetical protein [Leptolyngbya sp. CCNP1308]
MELELIDFHVPSGMVPEKIVHIKGQSIFLFPSKKKTLLLGEQISATSLGIIIYGPKDSLSSDLIGQKLNDIAAILGICSGSAELYLWLQNNWLDKSRSRQRLFHTDNISKFMKEYDDVDIQIDTSESPFPIFASFRNARVPQPFHVDVVVDVCKSLSSFMRLKEQDPLKSQIKLFSFALCSTQLLSQIYNNDNLRLSLIWAVLETQMAPATTKIKGKKCKNCGNIEDIEVSSDSKRIEKFLNEFDLPPDLYQLMQEFLKGLRKSIRNSFFHGGKWTSKMDAVNKMIAANGSTSFNLEADVRHGEGRFIAIFLLEFLLRINFFKKLKSLKKVG